jgi:hypothetical protein
MKRRKFVRYVALTSAGLAGVVSKNDAVAMKAKSSQSKSHYQWVVLYWMPYDNNLVRFGEPIIQMLTRGTENTEHSEIAIGVQSDYWGNLKMRRRQIKNGTIKEFNIAGEDSSNVFAFSEYLDWAHQTFEADHWAVIVVGHGGKINQISPDEHHAIGKPVTWMSVDGFAKAVSQLNRDTNDKVELLFFQNCNKATLEVIYEARNCARYTLASQLNLGAPNYYYEEFLNVLKDPLVDGREAAIAIMNSERADMYHSLTLVDNQAGKLIPEKLSPVLESILAHPLPTIRYSDLEIYSYFNELHCDVLILLGYLSQISHRGENELTEFSDFLRSSVITKYKTGGELYGSGSDRKMYDRFCGLSLFFPETEPAIYRYRSLALYQAVDFIGLYQAIITS